jgi:hypothetical protein
VISSIFLGFTKDYKRDQMKVIGRAIAQAVSRRLPTAAAWVQTGV